MKRSMKRGIVILLFIVFFGEAFAQRDTVAIRPLVSSLPTKIWADQYLYVGFEVGGFGGLRTANNNLNTIHDTLKHTSFEIGLQWDFQVVSLSRKSIFTDRHPLSYFTEDITYTLSIGYQYDKLSSSRDRWSDFGIHSHWLSVEAAVYGFRYVVIGFRSSIYLGGSTNSPDGWRYNGVNSDCYKQFTIDPFMGFRLKFANLFLEFRLYPTMFKIDIRETAYYNAVYNHGLIDNDGVIAIRLGIRKFTTAKKTR